MSIKIGSAADAGDMEKNILTYLEGINQTTILSQNASVTDKTYTNAESDTFSDSTGYNNNIDTGNTTARFVADRYILSSTIYDNFDDNSLDTGLWTKTESPHSGGDSATVNETNQKIEMTSSESSGHTGTTTAQLSSDTNYTDYLRWDADKVTQTAAPGGSYGVKVTIGGTIIVDKGVGATYDDYNTGTWEIFKVSTSVHRLYKNQVFVRQINSALSGAVVFRVNSNESGGSGNTAEHDFDNVYLNFDSSSVIQTSSKTFPANVQEILANVNKDTSLSGTSVTFDVSTDGGSVFEKTVQAFDTVISGLDNDNTGVVLKINLNRGTTSTPWIFGYSYQGWTA